MRKFLARGEWLKCKILNLHIRLAMPCPGCLTLGRNFPKIITKYVFTIDFPTRQPALNPLSRLIRQSLKTDIRRVADRKPAKIVVPAGHISLPYDIAIPIQFDEMAQLLPVGFRRAIRYGRRQQMTVRKQISLAVGIVPHRPFVDHVTTHIEQIYLVMDQGREKGKTRCCSRSVIMYQSCLLSAHGLFPRFEL